LRGKNVSIAPFFTKSKHDLVAAADATARPASMSRR